MSGMHWEKRNKEKKLGIPLSERFMRQPGWKDRPGPISFKKFFSGGRLPVDNVTPTEKAKRKGRVSLARISILEDH